MELAPFRNSLFKYAYNIELLPIYLCIISNALVIICLGSPSPTFFSSIPHCVNLARFAGSQPTPSLLWIQKTSLWGVGVVVGENPCTPHFCDPKTFFVSVVSLVMYNGYPYTTVRPTKKETHQSS